MRDTNELILILSDIELESLLKNRTIEIKKRFPNEFQVLTNEPIVLRSPDNKKIHTDLIKKTIKKDENGLIEITFSINL